MSATFRRRPANGFRYSRFGVPASGAVLLAALSATSAAAQTAAEIEPIAGKTISDLLEDGYEILDYELGTIRVNRFQIIERALLVKDASVYTCTFNVQRNEESGQAEKVSRCTPVR